MRFNFNVYVLECNFKLITKKHSLKQNYYFIVFRLDKYLFNGRFILFFYLIVV